MLEELFYLHNKTVENVPLEFKRYLYEEIDWKGQALCVSGPRGVGKTTLLLQHYHEVYGDVEKCLYLSADNVEVAAHGLLNAAKEYFKYGGEALIIDEIHKYPSWQIEIKNIIDTFKGKKVLFSGSSSLELQEGKADLSRRVVYYHLKGLSFREYLELKAKIKISAYRLPEVLDKHVKIAQEVSGGRTILKYFQEYLVSGYYPFFMEGEKTYLSRVLNIIEKVLYEDVAVIGGVRGANIRVIKRILWLIATSSPFFVNIEKMGRELKISKEYLYQYLEYLESAGLMIALRPGGKGYKPLRKPEKIFIENPNLLSAIHHSLMSESEKGVVRETFFANQTRGMISLALPDVGDFLVDGKYVFEIGGKDKNSKQIKGLKNAWIAADRIEIGHGNKIPLYLFGLLY